MTRAQQYARRIIRASNGGIMTITFRKSNGEIRTMNCTTNLDKHINGNGTERQKGAASRHGNIVVLDLTKKAIRSFKIESVLSISCNGIKITLSRREPVFRALFQKMIVMSVKSKETIWSRGFADDDEYLSRGDVVWAKIEPGYGEGILPAFRFIPAETLACGMTSERDFEGKGFFVSSEAVRLNPVLEERHA
jgi:hypothetical protein